MSARTTSAARHSVVRWAALPFLSLLALGACSDGGSSPEFVDEGNVSKHGSLRLSPTDVTVREGDSVQVAVTRVGGSGSFDASRVQWTVEPSRAGTFRNGFFVASYYGDVTLNASFSGATGSASANVLPAPREIRELSSSFFAGTAGRALPDSVAVLVTGRDGIPVSDIEVAYTVASGGGAVSPSIARTDAYGVARAKWTLGESVGQNALDIGVAQVGTTRLDAQGYADLETATVELLEGEGQEGVVGEPLPQPVRVQVNDANGNPIRGVTIEWSVPGDASEFGTFNGIPPLHSVVRTVSDAGGIARVHWRLPTVAGELAGEATLVPAGSGGPAAAPGNGNGKGNNKTDFSAKAKPGHLNKLDVTPATASTEVSGALTLEATATDKWGNTVEADYTWTSSDESVASVDAAGKLTSVKPGKASIKASAGPVSDSASITVLGDVPSSTEITGSGQTASVGETLSDPLTVRVLDQNGVAVEGAKVSWTVASGGGSLTAASGTTNAEGASATTWTLGTDAGEQNVLASVDGTNLTAAFSATAEAPAEAGVATIAVSPASSMIEVGSTTTLSAVAKDADGQVLDASITWSSSATGIATVADGVVTAVAEGSATITAKADGKAASAEITVFAGEAEDGPVALVQASSDAYTFSALGTSTQLSAVALDEAGTTLSGVSFAWSSNEPAIASVDQSGKVSAKAVGITSIIVCAAACSAADTVAVTVEQITASVEVTPASLSLEVGDSYQLNALVKDATGNEVPDAELTWKSSNTSRATITSSGVVSALAEGSVSFTATSGSSSDDSQVTVAQESDGGGGGSSGTPIFFDDFEGGDRSLTANGVRWSGSTSNAYGGVNMSTANPRSGTHSLRLRYDGAPLGTDGFAEQGFRIDGGLSEVYFEYYLHVPANYFHRVDYPTNNKLFRVWQDKSNSNTFSITTEYELTSACAGCSKHRMIAEQTGGKTIENNPNPLIGPNGHIVIGEWNQIRFGFKAASGLGKADGFYRMWVNGVLVSELANFEFWNKKGLPETLIEAGYLMGWSNSGWNEDTEFFVDDFKVYSSNPGW